ncbi:hypothetical protein [Bacillus infantis]|uniref:hypothetical protein n=1 Tax=Bacillus infantis TaxID=324767 RepID=UPI003CF209AC
MEFLEAQHLIFDYVNWKGIKGRRRVIAESITFKSTDFHKEEQWIMMALDMDKQETREFAMKDMSNVHFRGNCAYCGGWGVVKTIDDDLNDIIEECEMCKGTGS